MAFGASKNTLGYATDYMRIYALGTLFVQLTLGMNAFITAQGFTTTSMVSVLIGAICNITLDPVFIFVFNMGVKVQPCNCAVTGNFNHMGSCFS